MDERSQEEVKKEQTGLDNLLSKLYRPGPLIFLFTIAFLILVSFGFFILTEESPPPEVISETPPSAPAPRAYEEDTSTDMEDQVKQADLAIIETLRNMSLDLNDLDLLDVEMHQLNGKGFHYQVLKLPGVIDRTALLERLQMFLTKRIPEASMVSSDTNEIAISISGVPTHRLLLENVPLTLPRPQPKGPKLSIVIDDIGEDMKVLKGLVNLDFPLTLAVWPHATYTRKAVELISEKRRDLIIHFPMEPLGYPRYNPGDDALFVKMTSTEIRKQIAENVSRIPEAIGVNNHMGSRFTGNTAGMQVALTEFKKLGLFFLDSLTTGKSVARPTARNVDIPFYERDIFIDNVKDVNAIIHQLKKAEKLTLKQGYSIAIGHPYPETLAALKQWQMDRNQSIQLLPLSRLSPQ